MNNYIIFTIKNAEFLWYYKTNIKGDLQICISVPLKTLDISKCRNNGVHLRRAIFDALFKRSRLDVFCRKSVPRNFAKFTGKHLRQSLFLIIFAGLRRKLRWKETGFKKENQGCHMNFFLIQKTIIANTRPLKKLSKFLKSHSYCLR